MQIYRGSSLFQATYNIKTAKQIINSTYLVSVRCSEAGGRKRARDSLDLKLVRSPFKQIQLMIQLRTASKKITDLIVIGHVLPSNPSVQI